MLLILEKNLVMYKLINFDGKLSSIQKTDGENITYIPINLDNIDYQEYLKWVAEGNTPQPAE